MHDNRNRWHLILFSEINSLKYVIVALYNPSAVQIFFYHRWGFAFENIFNEIEVLQNYLKHFCCISLR